MRKYLISVSGIAISICLGSIYAWSTFIPAIKACTGLGQGPVQLPFTIFYITFPLTMIFAGYLLTRLGPRFCAILGGILCGGGWMMAGLGGKHFLFTTLGIGVLGGIGAGFAYLVPIATGVAWFPKHKGLITGIGVAGFGGGAILVSSIAENMLGHGIGPFDFFGVMGLIFLGVIILAGSIMAFPAKNISSSERLPFKLNDILSERMFWVLYLAMSIGLAAGLAVIANLKQLGRNEFGGMLINVVAIFAVTNAIGRIIWGKIFDQTSSSLAIRTNLILQSAVLLSSGLLLRSPAGFKLFAILAGFNYGGVLVVYAATVARRWGSERVGPIYGLLFSSHIPAACAPMLLGLAYDKISNYTIPLAILGISMACVALFAGFSDG